MWKLNIISSVCYDEKEHENMKLLVKWEFLRHFLGGFWKLCCLQVHRDTRIWSLGNYSLVSPTPLSLRDYWSSPQDRPEPTGFPCPTNRIDLLGGIWLLEHYNSCLCGCFGSHARQAASKPFWSTKKEVSTGKSLETHKWNIPLEQNTGVCRHKLIFWHVSKFIRVAPTHTKVFCLLKSFENTFKV